MASLTGTKIKDTYDSLLKVSDNGALDGTLQTITDGLGNNSALSLSTAGASIGGTLAVSGNAAFDTNTLFVDAANNIVGVGKTPANEKLEVSGALSIEGSLVDHKTNAATIHYFSNSGYLRAYGASDGDGRLIFETGGGGGSTTTERMRIHSGGDISFRDSSANEAFYWDASAASLGIGTAPANSETQLTVLGNFQSGFYRNITSGDRGYILNIGAKTGSGFGNAASLAGVLETGDASGYFVIQTLSGGTTTTRLRVDSDGLKFGSDSAAANALDDYEEGTWTPTISFALNSTGITYTVNAATYTKIGRQVTVNGYIELSSKGSSTGAARIMGLPFTIPNLNSNYSAASLRFGKISFANQFQGFGQINSTNILLVEITEAGLESTINDTEFVNDSNIMFSFTYFV